MSCFRIWFTVLQSLVWVIRLQKKSLREMITMKVDNVSTRDGAFSAASYVIS